MSALTELTVLSPAILAIKRHFQKKLNQLRTVAPSSKHNAIWNTAEFCSDLWQKRSQTQRGMQTDSTSYTSQERGVQHINNRQTDGQTDGGAGCRTWWDGRLTDHVHERMLF